MRFPYFDLEFIVQTDASGFAVGSVLAHRNIVNGQKEEYAVAYASQQLNETQEKWQTTDKEAYAIYHALKTFYLYLYGTKFTVETDHKALEVFPRITENMSKKVIRWALFASEFDFKTVFRPGVTNQNADTFSRIPKTTEDIVMSGQTQVIKALTTQTFAIEQEKDELCKKVRRKYEKYILWSESEDRNSYESENDNDTEDGDQIKEFENGLLGTADGKIFVPEAPRKEILFIFHDSPFTGHLRIKKTLARIQRRFKWPKMARDIKEYVSKCELCAKRKAVGTSKAPLNPIPPPTHVWQIMAMDIMDTILS